MPDTRDWSMVASGEGSLMPVTSQSCDGTVTGLGFPPSIFWIVLTIGHQSTDSILAGHQRGDRADVRKPLRAPLPQRLHGVTRGVAKEYGSQGRIQFHGPQGSGQDTGLSRIPVITGEARLLNRGRADRTARSLP